MRCTKCETPLPEGAIFCIECGAPVRAATGPTVILDPGRPPLTTRTADRDQQVGGSRTKAKAVQCHISFLSGGQLPFAHELSIRSGAVFIIGLAILILTGNV